MNDATLNFVGGLLAFLAVLIPLSIKIWRSAARRGTHRTLLSIAFSSCGFIAFIIAEWFYHRDQAPFALLCFGISFFAVIGGFSIDSNPPDRIEIGLFVMILCVITALVSLVTLTPHEYAAKPNESVIAPEASATPTATPKRRR